MILQHANRIRILISRFNSLSKAVDLNQGAANLVISRAMGSEIGSGSGKGGGTGGSVREAGGAMGKKGAAQVSRMDIERLRKRSQQTRQEEQYFASQNKAMKDKLKQHLKEEIKKHEDAIKASKELMKEMEK